MRRVTNRWIAVASVVFGGSVAALRVLGMAGFSNDHFYYLSRAEQVLPGRTVVPNGSGWFSTRYACSGGG